MIEFSKRAWPVLLISLATTVGLFVPVFLYLENPTPMVVMLSVFAAIFLTATIVTLYYDLRDAYRRDHPPPPGIRTL